MDGISYLKKALGLTHWYFLVLHCHPEILSVTFGEPVILSFGLFVGLAIMN